VSCRHLADVQREVQEVISMESQSGGYHAPSSEIMVHAQTTYDNSSWLG